MLFGTLILLGIVSKETKMNKSIHLSSRWRTNRLEWTETERGASSAAATTSTTTMTTTSTTMTTATTVVVKKHVGYCFVIFIVFLLPG